ncbi:MAG: CCA tRNA nucleotidyltransferase [Myxococcales bacterium]|nr:CCA tRNA nucleotidyltransferase [Myxococcales bacterium]
MTALPPPFERATVPPPVLRVLARLHERGFSAYLVGGCVRDMVRGVPPKDFDVATSARPEDVRRSFSKVIPTGIEHGTVTVLSGGHPVEVTTFRTEGAYLDGRHPSSVEFLRDIRADLARRDFTINAMAFDPDSRELVDPFGGQADLTAKAVRCVGDPVARFSEDGLRPLRAVRFAAVLGFTLDRDTEGAIPGALPVFKKVAQERVREELIRLLCSERPRAGLELMRRTALLAAILPELLACEGLSQDERYAEDVLGHSFAATQASGAVLEVRLSALLHDVAKPRTAVPKVGGHDFPQHEVLGAQLATEILRRLKFPTRVIEKVSLLVRHHRVELPPSAPDAALRRFVSRVGEANVELVLDLAEANRSAYGVEVEKEVAAIRSLRERVSGVLAARPPLAAKSLALDGHAIMRILGIGPSPMVGEATRFLLDLVLEDPQHNTPSLLEDALRNWAKSKGL